MKYSPTKLNIKNVCGFWEGGGGLPSELQVPDDSMVLGRTLKTWANFIDCYWFF